MKTKSLTWKMGKVEFNNYIKIIKITHFTVMWNIDKEIHSQGNLYVENSVKFFELRESTLHLKIY